MRSALYRCPNSSASYPSSLRPWSHCAPPEAHLKICCSSQHTPVPLDSIKTRRFIYFFSLQQTCAYNWCLRKKKP